MKVIDRNQEVLEGWQREFYVVGWNSPNKRQQMIKRLAELGYTAMTPISEPIGGWAIHAYGLTSTNNQCRIFTTRSVPAE